MAKGKPRAKKKKAKVTPSSNRRVQRPQTVQDSISSEPLVKSSVSKDTIAGKIPSYAYVFKDLKRIGIFAGIVLIIIIVLAIILR